MRRLLVLVVLAAAAAVFIGVNRQSDGPPTVVVDGREVWRIEIPHCDDGGDCAAGVQFGGRFWATVDVVRPEFTRGPLVGWGPGGKPEYDMEARAIEGFPAPYDVVALRTPGGWVAALADEGRMDRVTEKAWYDRLCQVVEECRRPAE